MKWGESENLIQRERGMTNFVICEYFGFTGAAFRGCRSDIPWTSMTRENYSIRRVCRRGAARQRLKGCRENILFFSLSRARDGDY
ncbi:hypothetical protein ANTPLA_LOCUS6257 [Anthophora plagiata]